MTPELILRERQGVQITCIQDHESVIRLGLIDEYNHVRFMCNLKETGSRLFFVYPDAGFDSARLEVAIETPEYI